MDVIRNYCKTVIGGAMIAALLALLPFSVSAAPHTSTVPEHAKAQNPFPLPSGLEPAVDFWCKVFAEWSREQVALHDDEHLGVIYRVVDIPGPVAEGLTSGQRAWVREQENRLISELSHLAVKRASRQSLTKTEQRLANAITYGGGSIKGAAERVRSQRGTRERFLRGLEISGRYDQAFRAVFRARGLPEDLAYLPHVESSFQIGARSSVGAAGMWQFMPSTARSYMTVSSTVDERLNPVTAAQGAAEYFAGAYRTLGSWPLAVTSYNHGIGSMNRAQARFGHDFGRIVRDYDAPSFGFSSRNFYAEFLAVRRIAKATDKYFPEGVRVHAPLAAKPVTLKHALYAHDIRKQMGADMTALADLNPGWSDRALKGKSKLPAGITVWVPSGKYVPEFTAPAETTTLARTDTASQPDKAGRTHRVTHGESLWTIARRHGTTVAALTAHNGLSAGDPHLRVGQLLVLPGAQSKATARSKTTLASTTHRVSAGDTPFDIATTYRIRLSDLLAANNMHARSVIRPGQRLTIPTAD
ncbi:MAG: LysM peptidoglycan-binding domain-containing protein [Gammaproteobacteria bacterium]|nr:LysM peptidoglycan-binding domain-containing protein [Gammaproteobacteria bacterium]